MIVRIKHQNVKQVPKVRRLDEPRVRVIVDGAVQAVKDKVFLTQTGVCKNLPCDSKSESNEGLVLCFLKDTSLPPS